MATSAIGRRGPDEPAAFQTLGIQRHAQAVMPKDFQQIAALAAEHVKIAGMRIAMQRLLHLQVPGCSCRGACPSSRSPARPAHPMAAQSSAQHRHHTAQRHQADIAANPDAGAVRQGDLDPVRGRPRCGLRRRRNGRRRGLDQMDWHKALSAMPRPRRARHSRLRHVIQQIGVNVMPRGHAPDAGTRFTALSNDPQLLLDAPAPPPFPAVEDFNPTARHLCNVHLKVDCQVISLARFQPARARRSSPEGYI